MKRIISVPRGQPVPDSSKYLKSEMKFDTNKREMVEHDVWEVTDTKEDAPPAPTNESGSKMIRLNS